MTHGPIFRAEDKTQGGCIIKESFWRCLEKCGVRLRPGEQDLLSKYLDPSGTNYLEYDPLLKVIDGVPVNTFTPMPI